VVGGAVPVDEGVLGIFGGFDVGGKFSEGALGGVGEVEGGVGGPKEEEEGKRKKGEAARSGGKEKDEGRDGVEEIAVVENGSIDLGNGKSGKDGEGKPGKEEEVRREFLVPFFKNEDEAGGGPGEGDGPGRERRGDEKASNKLSESGESRGTEPEAGCDEAGLEVKRIKPGGVAYGNGDLG